MKFIHALILVSSLLLVSERAAAAPAAAAGRSWTIAKILQERRLDVKDDATPRYCRGGAFKPCVCPRDVTKFVQYRPSVKECKGRAAIILSGRYLSAYSVVVRDYENKDRWPPQGVNGCTPFERDELGLNKCSVFKVQGVIPVENEEADAEVHCLGASGYSTLFRRVSRITVKLRDVPGSTNDPLERLCLAGATLPLN